MSPKWLAPCSITANSVSGSILKSVSGTPTSLLKLPEVAMVLPFSERISVVSSFTVVLPQEPVRETHNRKEQELQDSSPDIIGQRHSSEYKGDAYSMSYRHYYRRKEDSLQFLIAGESPYNAV